MKTMTKIHEEFDISMEIFRVQENLKLCIRAPVHLCHGVKVAQHEDCDDDDEEEEEDEKQEEERSRSRSGISCSISKYPSVEYRSLCTV